MPLPPLLVALIAGLVSAIGFAPLDWWPVTLACIAVLLWIIHAAPTLRSALLRGWVFGVGHFTVGNNWIQHAFDYQDRMPPVLGYFAVVLLALYLAVYPAMAMGLAWRFAHHGRRRDADLGYVLAASAAWIVTEYLRGVLFTGYPWNPLSAVWLTTPVAQLGSWIGTYALSGTVVLVAGTLFLAARRDFLPLLASAAVVALALINIALSPEPPASDARKVVVVQPNIGQENVGAPDYPERTLAKLIALSGTPGPSPRLLVWPEGMVNQLLEDGYPGQYYFNGDSRLTRARIAAVLGPADKALVSGNALLFADKPPRDPKVDPNAPLLQWKLVGAGNSVWTLDSSGTLGPRYDKAHLVPYGEYLPMRTILAPLGLARLVMGDVDFVPGPGPGTLDVGGFGKAGVQVCYEIIFSGQTVDRANRPDFLFNPSNDAWFGRWGPPQHLAQARMRAIEEGLPILRSTPTGISAVIDARGRILGSIPHGRAGALDLPLPRPLPPTLFARLGNWLAFLVAGLLLVLAIANRRFAR
ncbi:MAG: apolipoprotein N-acyltransferase [Sphingomonas sp.]|uniref:apolipoprotein N-acyltransferase n=1 Tax=Sphingomonas sp. TaxID=28214 RepID=UPI001AFF14D5|nr:apolipoprotein N-acyltransferase [Sphingomonas sp.]MBO9621211.1 apolipoprotein N-acyltransferase [Sphingomonas sp.]